MHISAAIMLLCGGLFAGGILTTTWNRLPAWEGLAFPAFKADFRQTLQVADTLQPALLVGAILSTVIFGVGARGLAAGLAFAAASAYTVVLAASLAILVPLQRRILASPDQSADIESMRRRWKTGHIGRTVVSIIAFGLTAGAIAI